MVAKCAPEADSLMVNFLRLGTFSLQIKEECCPGALTFLHQAGFFGELPFFTIGISGQSSTQQKYLKFGISLDIFEKGIYIQFRLL